MHSLLKSINECLIFIHFIIEYNSNNDIVKMRPYIAVNVDYIKTTIKADLQAHKSNISN